MALRVRGPAVREGRGGLPGRLLARGGPRDPVEVRPVGLFSTRREGGDRTRLSDVHRTEMGDRGPARRAPAEGARRGCRRNVGVQMGVLRGTARRTHRGERVRRRLGRHLLGGQGRRRHGSVFEPPSHGAGGRLGVRFWNREVRAALGGSGRRRHRLEPSREGGISGAEDQSRGRHRFRERRVGHPRRSTVRKNRGTVGRSGRYVGI
mmetsp:Transcript_17397/g.39276  ORF Transcript_17397/g.39276 Transcript_17397/m.39276 type:complete len:207 (+) Transcript_17397:1533-2153(+)